MLLNIMLAATVADQTVPSAPLFTLQSCDDPAARKAMLASGVDGLEGFGEIKRRSDENQSRTEVLLDRLAERAKLSREQRSQIALKMIDNSAFKSAHKEGNAVVEEMMARVGRMTGGDTAENCRIAIGMADLVPAIQAASDRQWTAMRGVLEAEAQKLGVSLAN